MVVNESLQGMKTNGANTKVLRVVPSPMAFWTFETALWGFEWQNCEWSCQRPDMVRLVHGCPSSSFSRSKSPCFVCWCLSVFVNSCGGCCSRCCSCSVLLFCLARATASHENPTFHHRPRFAQGIRPDRRLGLGFVVRQCKPMSMKVNRIDCQIQG